MKTLVSYIGLLSACSLTLSVIGCGPKSNLVTGSGFPKAADNGIIIELSGDGEQQYLVEGDMVMNRELLDSYLDEINKKKANAQIYSQSTTNVPPNVNGLYVFSIRERAPGSDGALIEMKDSTGKPVRWPSGSIITYTIDKSSFVDDKKALSPENYQMVVENFTQATTDWQSICGIKFRYVSELDSAVSGKKPSEIVDPVTKTAIGFVVRQEGVSPFVAMANYPNSSERFVKVDPKYYTTSLNKIGAFRHEIGHILGFMHEHDRCPPAPLPRNAISITDYDSSSVMHYSERCSTPQKSNYIFSETDKIGAVSVYGVAPPKVL